MMTTVKSFRLSPDAVDKLNKLVAFYRSDAVSEILPVGRISQATVVDLAIRHLYNQLKADGYDVP